MMKARTKRYTISIASIVGRIASLLVSDTPFSFFNLYDLINRSLGRGTSNWRELTQHELDELRKIYHDAVDYDKIKIQDTTYSAPFRFRENAIKYKIRMWNTQQAYKESYIYKGKLVHEVGHIWQYQQIGIKYIGGSLYAQCFSASKYDWRNEIKLGRNDWRDFNVEAQCQFVQDFYGTALRIGFSLTQDTLTDKAQIEALVDRMSDTEDKNKVVDIALKAFQTLKS